MQSPVLSMAGAEFPIAASSGTGWGPRSPWGEVEGSRGSQAPRMSRRVSAELPQPGECCFPGVLATKFGTVPQQLIIPSR